MGLSKREFAVLLALHDGGIASQRDASLRSGVSLGAVNGIIKKFREEGLLQNSGGGGSSFRPRVRQR